MCSNTNAHRDQLLRGVPLSCETQTGPKKSSAWRRHHSTLSASIMWCSGFPRSQGMFHTGYATHFVLTKVHARGVIARRAHRAWTERRRPGARPLHSCLHFSRSRQSFRRRATQSVRTSFMTRASRFPARLGQRRVVDSVKQTGLSH